jgi:DNA repair protein RecO (recombination protein O)
MPIHSAEAIVLRQYSLAESDRIIVLLTRETGKLRGVAQGVKKPGSRIAAALEPLNHLRLEYFLREGADLCRIRQCETVHSYLGRSPTLERVYAFTYLAEVAQEFVQENNPSPLFFRLLLASLQTGERHGASAALVRYFELWCLKLSGLLPNYERCAGCAGDTRQSGFYAWIDAGQGRCEACAGRSGLKVSAAAAGTLHAILGNSPEQFVSREIPEPAIRELERLTETLIATHLEKRLKSYALLKSVLRGFC